jgi:hypothetical protein
MIPAMENIRERKQNNACKEHIAVPAIKWIKQRRAAQKIHINPLRSKKYPKSHQRDCEKK